MKHNISPCHCLTDLTGDSMDCVHLWMICRVKFPRIVQNFSQASRKPVEMKSVFSVLLLHSMSQYKQTSGASVPHRHTPPENALISQNKQNLINSNFSYWGTCGQKAVIEVKLVSWKHLFRNECLVSLFQNLCHKIAHYCILSIFFTFMLCFMNYDFIDFLYDVLPGNFLHINLTLISS